MSLFPGVHIRQSPLLSFRQGWLEGSPPKKPLDFKAWVRWQCFYARYYCSVLGWAVGREGLWIGGVVKFMCYRCKTPLLLCSVQRLNVILRILRYLLSTRFVTADVDLNHSVYAVSLRESYFFTKIKIMPQHENNSSNIEDWDLAMLLNYLSVCLHQVLGIFFPHW